MNISPMAVWHWRVMRTIDREMFIVSIICGVSYLLAPFFFAEQIKTYWHAPQAILSLCGLPRELACVA